MAISNCLFLPTYNNPCEFFVWCVLAKLKAKPRNFSYTNCCQSLRINQNE